MQQDPNVRCPNFYETHPIEITADGGIFEFDDLPVQALQVATEDYFQGPRPLGKPCSNGREAYTYRLVRQGDIVFVKIEANPQECGRRVLSDEGATYAIGPDGKILHRHMGASLFDDYEGDPDGGRPASTSEIDVFEGDAPVALPPGVPIADGGTAAEARDPHPAREPKPSVTPDAGWPDGG